MTTRKLAAIATLIFLSSANCSFGKSVQTPRETNCDRAPTLVHKNPLLLSKPELNLARGLALQDKNLPLAKEFLSAGIDKYQVKDLLSIEHIARANLILGNYGKVIEETTFIIQYDKENASAYQLRGDAEEKLGKPELKQIDYAESQRIITRPKAMFDSRQCYLFA